MLECKACLNRRGVFYWNAHFGFVCEVCYDILMLKKIESYKRMKIVNGSRK